MAPDSGIIVREWDRRRDRGALSRWPEPTEAWAWLWAYDPFPPSAEERIMRQSWAIDIDGAMVGRITLSERVPGLRRARVGIYLSPAVVGQGVGTSALSQFLDLAFATLDLAIIRLDVAAANERAIKCYTRLGFHNYGLGQWRLIPRHESLALLATPQYHDMRRCVSPVDPPMALYFDMQQTDEGWRRTRERLNASVNVVGGRPVVVTGDR